MKSGDWYYTYVKDLYNAGIVNGTTPTTFSPQKTSDLRPGAEADSVGRPGIRSGADHDPLGQRLCRLAQQGLFPLGRHSTLDRSDRVTIAAITANALALTRTNHSPVALRGYHQHSGSDPV